MDELDVGGKKYISSKRASEITGYAKDYIGQLARAGKVAGTRFGRAWYVDEAALMKHLGKETPEIAPFEAPVTEEPIKTYATAQVSQATPKPLLTHHMISPSALPKTWSSVRYLEDTADLFPVITSTTLEESSIQKTTLASESKVPVRVARTEVEIERRVAFLVDGIRPQNAMLRTQPQVQLKPQPRPRVLVEEVRMQVPPKKIEKTLSVHWSAGSFATAFAAFVLVFGSFASFFVIKSVSLPKSESLTASTMYGLSDVLNMLKEARILEGGFESLTAFYALLMGSFGSFVETALQFIGGLF